MQYMKDGAVIAEGSYTLIGDTPPDPGNGAQDCEPSYPDFCIAMSPPDLDCPDFLPHQNFTVQGDDPHRFDADGDGVGCEPFTRTTKTPKPDPTPKPEKTRKPSNNGNCDPSYPTLCLPSSPDLDCGDIGATNFPVRGRDPHGFDRDGDGIGCES